MKMKTTLSLLVSFAVLTVLPAADSIAQNRTRPTLGVLDIQSENVIPNSEEIGRMARLEMGKINVYNVMDMYDVTDILRNHDMEKTDCFTKTCVLEAGKALKADKMLTGSVQRTGEKIAITFRVLDVNTGEIEKSYTQEYLNLQQEIQKMVEVSIRRLVGLTPDPNLENLLVSYAQPIQSPQTSVNLSGPRFGASYTTGANGERMTASRDVGGFDMYPLNAQIGWQHEVQYLSAGSFQGLFEFIGMVGGLESGKFIPSVTVLNGFRFGKQGWEFALGPSFRIVTKADGYYDPNDGSWHLQGDWNPDDGTNPNPIVSRLDSRGNPTMSVGLILGAGRTFKSGYLNMPVNVYVSPRKDGWIIGASFGFNILKKSKVED
jgi:hypothetical protein